MAAEGKVLCSSEGGTKDAASTKETGFLVSPATDSMPEYRSASSISQPPVFKTLIQGAAAGCTTCGRGNGDGGTLHRLKQDGAVHHHCSSCILFLYKGMYCSLCFLVYRDSVELGDPVLWLTCAKCQRLSHLECARDRDLRSDSLLFTCHDCSNPTKVPAKDGTAGSVDDETPAHKKLRLTTDLQERIHTSDEEALAAAHIVAFLAANQAKDAKARARASAAAAAKAAASAKAALDTAYRAAREEARWRHVVSGKDRGTPSYSGAHTMEIRRLKGVHDHPHLLSRLPSCGGQVVKNPNNVIGGASKTQFIAAYHKTKALMFASEATQAPSSSLGAIPQGGVFRKPQSVCMQEAMVKTLHAGPSMASEGVVICASPASILDSVSLLETPRSGSSTLPAQAHVGVPKAAVETNSSCSTVLIVHDSSGTVSENHLVLPDRENVATDGSITVPCPVRGILVTDTLGNAWDSTNEVNGKELKTFSPGTEEAEVDDYVDVGALLSEGCDKEGQLLNGFVEVEKDSAHSVISADRALVIAKTGDVRHEKGTQSSDDDSVAEETKYAGQSNGEQGKCVHDDSAVFGY